MNLEIPTDVINFIMGGAVFSIMMLFMQLQMRYSENQAIKRKRKMNELTENQIERINTILNEASTPKPVEPKKKIIDLTKMIESDVDMEFGKNTLVIGKLANMGECGDHVNYSMNPKQKGWYHQCRVRQNHHVHWYNGIGNPLPDGLLVILYFEGSSNKPPMTYKSQTINWDGLYDISGYEVMGTLPEYCYEWEK